SEPGRGVRPDSPSGSQVGAGWIHLRAPARQASGNPAGPAYRRRRATTTTVRTPDVAPCILELRASACGRRPQKEPRLTGVGMSWIRPRTTHKPAASYRSHTRSGLVRRDDLRNRARVVGGPM